MSELKELLLFILVAFTLGILYVLIVVGISELIKLCQN